MSFPFEAQSFFGYLSQSWNACLRTQPNIVQLWYGYALLCDYDFLVDAEACTSIFVGGGLVDRRLRLRLNVASLCCDPAQDIVQLITRSWR